MRIPHSMSFLMNNLVQYNGHFEHSPVAVSE